MTHASKVSVTLSYVTRGGEDLDSDEETPVIEVVETSRSQITQESEQEPSALVESDDILGVDHSPDHLETSVREFPQVVEPEQNLVDAVQGNTTEINLTDTAQVDTTQVRESEKVLTVALTPIV